MTSIAGSRIAADTDSPVVEATPLYQLFMLALCVIALATIVVRSALPLEPEVDAVLDRADDFICIAFAIDFFVASIYVLVARKRTPTATAVVEDDVDGEMEPASL